MKKLTIIYFLLFSAQIAYCQSVLMTINKDTIYADDFEKNQKNNLQQLGTRQTLNNFIDFNLLKQYSIKKGILNSQAYLSQFNKESEKLKDSLYYSQEIITPLLKDYYQKLQTERKVQLLLFKEEILPQKKIDKYINSALKQINNEPAKFEETVKKYSSEQQYKSPVYIDIFTLTKPLVDAIYNAPLNQVVTFKTTDNKYYLILVTKERKFLGNVVWDGICINDLSEKGKQEAELIYKGIKNPEDFIEAKNKYSPNAHKKKDFYENIVNDTLYDYIINTKESTVFPPIKTNEGYKIYKYFFRDSFDNYNNSKNKIFAQIKKTNEIKILNDSLIQELRKEPFFKENKENIKKFNQLFPASYEDFQKMEIDNEKDLVIIGKEFRLSNKQLLEQVKQISKAQYPNVALISQYILDDWANKALINYYNLYFTELKRNQGAWKNLENQLLIKLAIKNIIKEAQDDVEGQKEFLEQHSNNLTWKERIQGTLYYCLDAEVEKKVLQMLEKGKSIQYINNYFKGKTDAEKNVLLTINQGKFTPESVKLPPNEKLTKKIYTTDYKTGKLIISIDKIIEGDKMTLKELQTRYMNEYIDYKIDTTLQQLKKEATIHIDSTQEDYLKKKYGL